MSLAQTLDPLLAPGHVEAESAGHHAEVDVLDVDRLGARVGRIRVTGPPLDVRTRAERLPDALERGLGERMRQIEVAPELGGAVLRGAVDAGRYYEAQITPESVEIQSIDRDTREARPFTLTREQLGRVIDGLATS